MDDQQFISDIIGHILSWPVAVIVLGLIFRRPLLRMLSRVSRISYPGGEAELVAIAASTRDLQETVEEAAAPLPEDRDTGEHDRRRHIESLIREASEWGWRMAELTKEHPPRLSIEWSGAEPRIVPDPAHKVFINQADRLALVALLADYLMDPPPRRPRPRSYTDAAGRLGWTRTTLVKRIEYLRARLANAGVPHLKGPHALEELAEYVLARGIITKADASLIPVPRIGRDD